LLDDVAQGLVRNQTETKPLAELAYQAVGH
jgi:hypothetical protein